MLEILDFLLGRISDDNVNNFSILLEVLNDLSPSDGGVELVDKNLVIIIVSTDIEIIVTNFY